MKAVKSAGILLKNIASGKGRDILALACVWAVLVLLQFRVWITHERMASHDSLAWFGVFYYFADSLYQGILPLWNPYLHCGEPFFLNFYFLRLLDPLTLALVFLGRIFRWEILTLYHWDLLLRYLVFLAGSYLVFRRIARRFRSAFLGVFILAFSSLGSSYLRQHGFVYACYLFPLCLYFLLKYLEERESRSFLIFLYMLGIAALSYHFAFIAVSLLACFGFLLATRAVGPFRRPVPVKGRLWLLASGAVFLFLTAHLFPAFAYFRQFALPSARLEAFAAHSAPADFLVLFAPYAFIIHFFNDTFLSESFLYIGLLPLLFACAGLFFARHKYRAAFALMLGVLLLFMTGPVFDFLRAFVPFFATIRNTHTFGPLFVFFLVCFACWGLDLFFDVWEGPAGRRARLKFLFLGAFIALASGVSFLYFQAALPWKTQAVNTLSGRLALTDGAAVSDLARTLDQSWGGILLFGAGFFVLFVLRAGTARRSLRVAALFIFVAADLFLFHAGIFPAVTMQRRQGAQDSQFLPGEPVYKDERLTAEVRAGDPFYGYKPLLVKRFAASLKVQPVRFSEHVFVHRFVPPYFFELRDYFLFWHNQGIPNPVKEVVAGIPSGRLRLFEAALVVPAGTGAGRLERSDAQTARKVLLIEDEGGKPALDEALGAGGGGPAGGVSVGGFSPNRVEVFVDLNEPGFLYYADSFDPYWEAYRDGKRQKISKANSLFKAVALPAGRHTVLFQYNPRFYRFCLALYIFGNLCFFFLLGLLRKNSQGKIQ